MRLHDAPGRLSRVREHAHHPQQRAAGVGRRLPQVAAQEALLRACVELVVDGQVAEVEKRVAHPGVLPVHEQEPAVLLRADDVPKEKVVVAWPPLGVPEHRRDPRRDADRLTVLGGQGASPLLHDPRVSL